MCADPVAHSRSCSVTPLAADARERYGSAEHDAVRGMLVSEEARELVEGIPFGGVEVQRDACQEHKQRGVGIEAMQLGQETLDG